MQLVKSATGRKFDEHESSIIKEAIDKKKQVALLDENVVECYKGAACEFSAMEYASLSHQWL